MGFATQITIQRVAEQRADVKDKGFAQIGCEVQLSITEKKLTDDACESTG